MGQKLIEEMYEKNEKIDDFDQPIITFISIKKVI